MKKVFIILTAVVSLFAVVSCGGSKEHKYTEKELLLVDKNWAPDLNANLQSDNDALEDATGISSDFQLGGDVKTIGDFFAGKYLFGKSKDKTELVYSITSGEGFFSSTVGAGRWEMTEDGKYLLLTPYDYDEGKYAETPTKYEILELTESNLSWKEEGSSVTKYFTSK